MNTRRASHIGGSASVKAGGLSLKWELISSMSTIGSSIARRFRFQVFRGLITIRFRKEIPWITAGSLYDPRTERRSEEHPSELQPLTPTSIASSSSKKNNY